MSFALQPQRKASLFRSYEAPFRDYFVPLFHEDRIRLGNGKPKNFLFFLPLRPPFTIFAGAWRQCLPGRKAGVGGCCARESPAPQGR